MIEITALMSNIVVIGKKNLNPGRSMTISPGRRNSGRRLIQDQARPGKTRLAPYRLISPSIAPIAPPIADDSQS